MYIYVRDGICLPSNKRLTRLYVSESYKRLIAVAKSARHMELNYKDWKDMLVSKTTVSSEDASVADQHELQYET